MNDRTFEAVGAVSVGAVIALVICAFYYSGVDSRQTQVELARITHDCPLKETTK